MYEKISLFSNNCTKFLPILDFLPCFFLFVASNPTGGNSFTTSSSCFFTKKFMNFSEKHPKKKNEKKMKKRKRTALGLIQLPRSKKIDVFPTSQAFYLQKIYIKSASVSVLRQTQAFRQNFGTADFMEVSRPGFVSDTVENSKIP